MRWAEIAIEITPDSADAVTEILIDAGCGGTVTSGGFGPAIVKANATILSGEATPISHDGDAGKILRTAQNDGEQVVAGYLPVDDRLEARLETIRERVRALPSLGLALRSDEICIKWVEDDDWATAWKEFFKPVRFGRVVVKPSWEEYDASPGDVIVELDPGMAFGTGNHPTTALCLHVLQDYIKVGETVLDVGTGSGILAIAAQRLGAARVTGLDIDALAVRIARDNVANLGLSSIIQVEEASSPAAYEGLADVVVANIIPNVIIAMSGSLCEKVKPGGILVTSGIIVERADEVRAKLESVGLETVEQREDGGWVAIVSRRSILRQAQDEGVGRLEDGLG